MGFGRSKDLKLYDNTMENTVPSFLKTITLSLSPQSDKIAKLIFFKDIPKAKNEWDKTVGAWAEK